jgi:hypothetical protein
MDGITSIFIIVNSCGGDGGYCYVVEVVYILVVVGCI